MQDRDIIDEEIDPEDFLHVDEDEPTSAISTDEEIVDCIRNKAGMSDDRRRKECLTVGTVSHPIETVLVSKSSLSICMSTRRPFRFCIST